MSVTSDERRALADLFDELGPDAPTLCGGWTTRELLAHLIVRERRLDAAPGILIPAFAKRTERVMAEVAGGEFSQLVDTFRSGAPKWAPLGWPIVKDQANLFEFFVHHEDVRRAQPEWQPRVDDAARDGALWKSLKLASKLLFRKSPVGVILHTADRDEIVARKGDPAVTLVGLPGEIVLIGFGRPVELARVVIEGHADDVAAFVASERGV